MEASKFKVLAPKVMTDVGAKIGSNIIAITATVAPECLYLESSKFRVLTVVVDGLATVGAKDSTVMTDVGTNSMKNVETSRVNVVAPKGTPECLYLESSKFKGSTVVVDTAARVLGATKVDSNGKVSTVVIDMATIARFDRKGWYLVLPLMLVEYKVSANFKDLTVLEAAKFKVLMEVLSTESPRAVVTFIVSEGETKFPVEKKHCSDDDSTTFTWIPLQTQQ